ncbi:MAG: permease [Desulfobulbaceae bacterium]|nr:MAG: permease [Desulfobulbaceae bacterium]
MHPRHWFLLLVLVVYGLFALLDPAVTAAALGYFFSMLRKVIPILALVFVVMLLVNIFLDPARIRRHLGKDSGLRGWFYAIVSGIVISGPPFVLYPMLGDLKRHGARNALLATMLYNRNVKVYFLPAIVYYFGLRYAVVLSVYIIVFSVLNGMLLEFFVRHD